MRIVSLLPSATEIVCALGLVDQLVGVTHECDFPFQVQTLPKVTKTLIPTLASSAEIDQLVRERMTEQRALYTLDIELLHRLAPDLIVTQALCDVCAVAEAEVREAACSLPGSPVVLNLEPQKLEEMFRSITAVAAVTDREVQGERVVAALRNRIEVVTATPPRKQTVVLLEWLDPLFCCGHWMPELVRLAGGEELIGREGERSQQIGWEQLRAADPEVIIIACCGFDVQRTLADLDGIEAHSDWTELRAVRRNQVFICDGSHYFSRPGPRLVDSVELLHALFVGKDIESIPAQICVRVTRERQG